MNIVKLFILFIFILTVNKILLKINYEKIFKKNSSNEIFIINMLLSIIIGYLLYMSFFEIYNLSTNLVK
ncbi:MULTISPECIES: DUF1146 family protein [unclassified Gemella]|uniref:DUF1146 family protein n=1 Tax=unclassified Gemella TaxID=2624949 RepID=UPI001C043C26|nr:MULTISPECIES: DUF1146 family protein [unclassified Gemella]MBU0278507.1 DUF1146 family protein [Gemella sp. zg-1178]QWQ39456.1 DUF1146 family protein [Gemella sp. zg-570]